MMGHVLRPFREPMPKPTGDDAKDRQALVDWSKRDWAMLDKWVENNSIPMPVFIAMYILMPIALGLIGIAIGVAKLFKN